MTKRPDPAFPSVATDLCRPGGGCQGEIPGSKEQGCSQALS